MTFHPVNRHSDKLHGISLGGIEPGRELVDIPVQMSFAHVAPCQMLPVFHAIQDKNFNLRFTYHADAILHEDLPQAARELDGIISAVTIPIVELVRGGGGEAQVTQRLRNSLHQGGWGKHIFEVEKKINKRTTFSQSHEVDHIKDFEYGTVALEVEWNNKDPFFDRDLENFNRLHADGGISVGMIITRGDSFQNGIEERILSFAESRNIHSFIELEEFGIDPTRRQRQPVEHWLNKNNCSFSEAWAACFTRDKIWQHHHPLVQAQEPLRPWRWEPMPDGGHWHPSDLHHG